MADRPILFSAPMVRAILAGTKTQTRRVVRGLHPDCATALRSGIDWKFYDSFDRLTQAARCKIAQPGDRLWVRETWAVPHRYDHLGPSNIPPRGVPTHFAASEERSGLRWRSSIHMPRWVSRITLEVTRVRVEPLQDINEADALAEGIVSTHDGYGLPDGEHYHAADPRQSYLSLWEAINGPGSVETNPLVWVVEFKRTGDAHG